jgi:hypothetical protein
LIRTVLNNDQWKRIAPDLPGKVGDPGAHRARQSVVCRRQDDFDAPDLCCAPFSIDKSAWPRTVGL